MGKFSARLATCRSTYLYSCIVVYMVFMSCGIVEDVPRFLLPRKPSLYVQVGVGQVLHGVFLYAAYFVWYVCRSKSRRPCPFLPGFLTALPYNGSTCLGNQPARVCYCSDSVRGLAIVEARGSVARLPGCISPGPRLYPCLGKSFGLYTS